MAASEAPFLHEYFEKTAALTKSMLENPEELMATAMTPDGNAALKAKVTTFFNEEAKPLLQQSFKHHDTKNTNVLDKEEAAVFFSHLVAEEEAFVKGLMSGGLQQAMGPMLGMLEGMVPPDQREAMKAQIEAYMKTALGEVEGKVANVIAEYKEKKEEKDAALFKVMDTSGDGSIQLEEFIACFEPESAKNKEIMVAFGLDPESLQPTPPDPSACMVM